MTVDKAPKIALGFNASKDKIEPLIGRRLPDSVFNLSVTGHRVLIARDTVKTLRDSGLYIPQASQEREQKAMGAGWIIGVGPLAGAPGAPHPVGIQCEHPSALLYKHVIFFMWSGKVLKVSDTDDEFSGAIVIMTDRDIQIIDIDPKVYEPKAIDGD